MLSQHSKLSVACSAGYALYDLLFNMDLRREVFYFGNGSHTNLPCPAPTAGHVHAICTRAQVSQSIPFKAQTYPKDKDLV